MATVTQPTNEDVKALLKACGITRQEAADLLHVSVDTIHGYCDPTTSRKSRGMPLASWELLLLKLGQHPTKALVDK